LYQQMSLNGTRIVAAPLFFRSAFEHRALNIVIPETRAARLPG
jgi:hypothetical protein